MAIIIFCGLEERKVFLENIIKYLEGCEINIFYESYRDLRSKINKTINEINILNSNFLKSERYELYLIAKRHGVPYCVINFPANSLEDATEKNRYDNPYIDVRLLTRDWLLNILKTKMGQSIAHKRIIFNEEYLSKVKALIENVNKKHGSLFFFEELEKKMIKMLQSNPLMLDNVERIYEDLIIDKLKTVN